LFVFYETFSLILKLVLWIPKTYGFSHFLKKLRASPLKDNTRRNLVHFGPMFATNVQIKSFYDCTFDNFTCHHSCMLAITYVTTLRWTHILIVHAISICDYHQYKWKIWYKEHISSTIGGIHQWLTTKLLLKLYLQPYIDSHTTHDIFAIAIQNLQLHLLASK